MVQINGQERWRFCFSKSNWMEMTIIVWYAWEILNYMNTDTILGIAKSSSKLTRQSLKCIRVKTKEELVERIYKYFDEANEEPAIYHWKYKLEEIDSSETLFVDTLPLNSPVN